jgi:hypothetical protein
MGGLWVVKANLLAAHNPSGGLIQPILFTLIPLRPSDQWRA